MMRFGGLVGIACVAIACSGGPGTVSTGAPNERPPSSNERAPNSTDPAGPTSGGTCYACARWRCANGGQTVDIHLNKQSDGSCTFQNGQKVDPCASTTFKPINDVTTTFEPNGTSLKVCYVLTQASSACLDCVPVQ